MGAQQRLLRHQTPDSFDSGLPTPLCRPIFLFRSPFVQESDGSRFQTAGDLFLRLLLSEGFNAAQLSLAASPVVARALFGLL
eukprot:372505-Pleurochrysis_carterae.AAC.1